MDALNIWRYGAAERAEAALRDLERLQHRGRASIDDSAVVSWATGARRPRAYQAGTVEGTGLSGAFWGLVFSLAFLLPPSSTAGVLAGIGLSDGLLRDLRARIVPGTSALFVLTADGQGALHTALTDPDAELIVHAFAAEHGTALLHAFAVDEQRLQAVLKTTWSGARQGRRGRAPGPRSIGDPTMTPTLAPHRPSFARPGSPAFEAARAGFDLSAIPTPDLVVAATAESDVADAVRYAAARGIPVAVRATGHGTGPAADRGVLVDTRALDRVVVDPRRRTATIAAGVKWTQVLAACAPFGLAPLCGSSPDVGAVGYSLGGGLGPLGRAHGWAADHVRRLRLVTPTGERCEVSPTAEPELFWALRGGGGNFGVVTEMEIDLVPAADLHGGGLYLPGEVAPDLLAAFGRVTATAPDALSLSVAILTLPPVGAVPAPLRGRFVAHVRVTHLGSREEAEALIAPLRAVAAPIVDTVRPLPIVEIGSVHADPIRPQPVSCGSAVLPAWDDAAVAVLLDEVGPTTPHMLEIRHLGGALARPVDNAVGHRDARYSVFTSAYPGPGFATAADLQAVFYRRLARWSAGRSLYNFTAGSDGRRCFDAPTRTRLAALKQQWDPEDLFRFAVGVQAPRGCASSGPSRRAAGGR